MTRVLITGASGFLGRALVARARAEGMDVVALTRGRPSLDWGEDPQITFMRIDLGEASSVEALRPVLGNVEAVIHAAASFSGDAAAQMRDTQQATDLLLQALVACGPTAPRLVLVSSLSVYDVAAMQDDAVLSEASPLVHEAAQRDGYAAAKARQERQVLAANLAEHVIVRPGAIYGPGRLWSAQLGFAKAGRAICPGGEAYQPAISVDHAAAGLLRAARKGVKLDGPVNLIDPDPPRQIDWLVALNQRVIRVPRRLVLMAGRSLGRGASWQARFRPLHYDMTRAQSLMDHLPYQTFSAGIAAARQAELRGN